MVNENAKFILLVNNYDPGKPLLERILYVHDMLTAYKERISCNWSKNGNETETPAPLQNLQIPARYDGNENWLPTEIAVKDMAGWAYAIIKEIELKGRKASIGLTEWNVPSPGKDGRHWDSRYPEMPVSPIYAALETCPIDGNGQLEIIEQQFFSGEETACLDQLWELSFGIKQSATKEALRICECWKDEKPESMSKETLKRFLSDFRSIKTVMPLIESRDSMMGLLRKKYAPEIKRFFETKLDTAYAAPCVLTAPERKELSEAARKYKADKEALSNAVWHTDDFDKFADAWLAHAENGPE